MWYVKTNTAKKGAWIRTCRTRAWRLCFCMEDNVPSHRAVKFSRFSMHREACIARKRTDAFWQMESYAPSFSIPAENDQLCRYVPGITFGVVVQAEEVVLTTLNCHRIFSHRWKMEAPSLCTIGACLSQRLSNFERIMCFFPCTPVVSCVRVKMHWFVVSRHIYQRKQTHYLYLNANLKDVLFPCLQQTLKFSCICSSQRTTEVSFGGFCFLQLTHSQ